MFVEEGISGLRGGVNICILNYGNSLAAGRELKWVSAADFDSSPMFDGEVLGASNLYFSLKQLHDLLAKSKKEQSLVMVICTYCGASDTADVLDHEAKEFYNKGSRNILIYGCENPQIPIRELSINSDLIFTAGTESNVDSFKIKLEQIIGEISSSIKPGPTPDDSDGKKAEATLDSDDNNKPTGNVTVDPDDPFA